jgi:hypothetical protein
MKRLRSPVDGSMRAEGWTAHVTRRLAVLYTGP